MTFIIRACKFMHPHVFSATQENMLTEIQIRFITVVIII